MKPLTRDEFRESVFSRDSHKCVICGNPAKDAHHILERRLFEDGGYYLDNGASLCEVHHIEAETTDLSVESIREACGIKTKILPAHFYKDVTYTKWGDTVLENGKRTPGELFHDESVQKILKHGNSFPLYTVFVKYPRTYHLPWSGYIGKDDKLQNNLDFFNDDIVVSLKMDGENTTLYRDYMHARSVDGRSHWTQSWVRQFHSSISHEIPEGFRFCGENLFAQHSIPYENLGSYFYLFSIWNNLNECLSWEETELYSSVLDLKMVPVIFKGRWKDKPEKIHDLWKDYDESKNEGYVIRSAKSFHYSQFRYNTAKYVRKNHVTSATHWKYDRVEQNQL